MQTKIEELLYGGGAGAVSFCRLKDENVFGLGYAVSYLIPLSDAVIDQIDNAPTHTYFHHYRTVNAFIYRLVLKTGIILQNHGYKYIPIGASQSININGWNYNGRYSHKKAASLAHLGGIGKNSLFLHKDYGARVRLGTLFTNCEFETKQEEYHSPCTECDRCVKACPSGAIKGTLWQPGTERSQVFDPEKCSEYMKKNFKHIGRGAVCGICMSVCPAGKEKEE